ncbi:hypothetical protein AHF37_07756 [Paragonimus kellicotti]|nr:hypothetical protein AHF37_07756 [Paragonimus kellicotti]
MITTLYNSSNGYEFKLGSRFCFCRDLESLKLSDPHLTLCITCVRCHMTTNALVCKGRKFSQLID